MDGSGVGAEPVRSVALMSLRYVKCVEVHGGVEVFTFDDTRDVTVWFA